MSREFIHNAVASNMAQFQNDMVRRTVELGRQYRLTEEAVVAVIKLACDMYEKGHEDGMQLMNDLFRERRA